VRNAIKTALKMAIPAKIQPAVKTAYRKLWYFGFAHKCPFCGSHFREFLPLGLNHRVLREKQVVGGGYRLNSVCPACGSLDRERLLYLYLLHKSDIFTRPCKLLHLAPEEQLEKVLRRCSNIDHVTADLLSPIVMARMDITRIPLPDDSFDVIICCHVLEHIIDDQRAITELYRVLKPGGWAILQVPISPVLEKTFEDYSITTPEGRGEAFGQQDHVRLYARDYEKRLARAGFRVELFSWLAEPEKFGGRKNFFCLIMEEWLYVARKL